MRLFTNPDCKTTSRGDRAVLLYPPFDLMVVLGPFRLAAADVVTPGCQVGQVSTPGLVAAQATTPGLQAAQTITEEVQSCP